MTWARCAWPLFVRQRDPELIAGNQRGHDLDRHGDFVPAAAGIARPLVRIQAAALAECDIDDVGPRIRPGLPPGAREEKVGFTFDPGRRSANRGNAGGVERRRGRIRTMNPQHGAAGRRPFNARTSNCNKAKLSRPSILS